MIKPEYIELMNQELDGVNSPQQSRELEEYLSGHAAARAYYRELVQTVGVFEQVEMLDPPPGLGNSILAQVDQRGGWSPVGDSFPARKSLWSALGDRLRPRLQPAYAFTFLAGLALGLAAFTGFGWLTDRHPTAGWDGISGTANHRSWDPGAVTEGTLELPGVTAQYRTLSDGSSLQLHLELETREPAVIQFQPGPNATLQAYRATQPVPPRLKVAANLVELNHEGHGSYDLAFRRDPDDKIPLQMLVFSEGRLIKTQTLENQDP